MTQTLKKSGLFRYYFYFYRYYLKKKNLNSDEPKRAKEFFVKSCASTEFVQNALKPSF